MKLITWNVQWCRGCDGRVDPERIVREARAFSDFDVLCVQEVADNFPGLAGSAGEDQFACLAAALPGYQAVPGIAVDVPDGLGGRRRFGNLVLSRLPVGRVLRHQLPWPPGSERPGMPRVLIEAIVTAPFGALRVMTTHLEYFSAAHRSAQVDAIRAVQSQSVGRARDEETRSAAGRSVPEGTFGGFEPPASAVLTGDFNYEPDDPLQARMTAPLPGGGGRLVDAWTARHPEIGCPPTNGVHDRVQWPRAYTCDFIYVSEDLVPRIRDVAVDGSTSASDHQPVLIELG